MLAELRGSPLIGNLNIEEIAEINNGVIDIDGSKYAFSIGELKGSGGSLFGNDLEKFLDRHEGIASMLIVCNQRWFAMKRLGSYIHVFNCHSTAKNGKWDMNDQEPAVVYRVKTNAEAAKALKLFALAYENPHGIFYGNDVIIQKLI